MTTESDLGHCSVRLLDETAVLACAAYVDLNPIRAAMAEAIKDSDFTSAQKRVRDLAAQHEIYRFSVSCENGWHE